jgi:3-oxoadipate enol-lactonase
VAEIPLPLIEHAVDDFTLPWTTDSESVVLLHPGLGGNFRLYAPWIPCLGDRYRVLRVTARGQGGTERPADRQPSLHGYAQDALALLSAKGIQKVHWVGASGGGILGQYIAITYPEHIASLSLIATTARFRSPREDLDDWLAPLDNGNHRDFLQHDAERRFGIDEPERRDWIISELSRTSGAESALLHRWIVTVNLLDEIHQISCPTLIVTGEKDTLTSTSDSDLMHQRIPDSRVVILPDRPHNIAYTHPHEVATVVRTFLDEIRE